MDTNTSKERLRLPILVLGPNMLTAQWNTTENDSKRMKISNSKKNENKTTKQQTLRKKYKKKKLRFDQLNSDAETLSLEENESEMTAVIPLQPELENAVNSTITKDGASRKISFISNGGKLNYSNGVKPLKAIVTPTTEDKADQAADISSNSNTKHSPVEDKSDADSKLATTATPTENTIPSSEAIPAHDAVSSADSTTAQTADAQLTEIPHIITRASTPIGSRSSTPPSARWRSIRHAVKVSSLTKKRQEDSFMEKFNTNRRVSPTHDSTELEQISEQLVDEISVSVKTKAKKTLCKTKWCKCSKPSLKEPFTPDGSFIFYWLFILSLAVEYNLWIQILRQAFTAIQERLPALWFTCDALADIIYLVDIAVQLRTGYFDDGLLVNKQSQLVNHYVKSRYFILDVICLLPLDFLYFALGIQPLLRFPRFLKIYRLAQFLYIAENRAAFPNVLRVCNLTHILLLLCHWFAAFYFMISKAEGYAGSWTEPGNSTSDFSLMTRQYLTSLYWSTLTLTTIGDLPSPTTNWKYLFQILSYLIGVFVFATIVGQVGNAINNYNSARQEYEKLLDGAKLYMRKHNVPKDMQVRVQRWCDYAWSRGRMHGAMDINSLAMLPDRLKTELALHVHLDILKQVSIFEDCEPEFLHDLVLKMQTNIYTPGDLVIRRGEIAREMFIIADGHCEVIGQKGKMIAKLSTGNFFGEIGILNLDGGINRRTADVRSVGYSELFVLKREDIVKAIKYYPSAKASLMKHAKNRLAEMRKQNVSSPELKASTDTLSPPSRPSSATTRPHSPRRPSRYYNGRRSFLIPLQQSGRLRQSIFSIQSLDPNDSLRIRENEYISQLRQDVEDRDKEIEDLREELKKSKESSKQSKSKSKKGS